MQYQCKCVQSISRDCVHRAAVLFLEHFISVPAFPTAYVGISRETSSGGVLRLKEHQYDDVIQGSLRTHAGWVDVKQKSHHRRLCNYQIRRLVLNFRNSSVDVIDLYVV